MNEFWERTTLDSRWGLAGLNLAGEARPAGWSTLRQGPYKAMCVQLFIMLCTHTDLSVQLCTCTHPQKVLPHGFSCFSEMSGQIVSDYFLQLLPPSSTTLKIINSKGNFKKLLFENSLPLIECIVQRSKHSFQWVLVGRSFLNRLQAFGVEQVKMTFAFSPSHIHN